MGKPKKDGMYFCLSCQADIRLVNVLYHKSISHDVRWFSHDPRQKGDFKMEDDGIIYVCQECFLVFDGKHSVDKMEEHIGKTGHKVVRQ